MMGSCELVEFLKARLKEDELEAWEAGGVCPYIHGRYVDPSTVDESFGGNLVHQSGSSVNWEVVTGKGVRTDRNEYGARFPVASGVSVRGFHIARHDPARVLREVDAKRRIVDDMAEVLRKYLDVNEADTAEVVLQELAAVYADHPDYREEWRP